MSISVVNFKMDSSMKRQAQRKAEKLGMSLSTALNLLIRKFIRVRDIDFTEEKLELEPTEWLKKEIHQAQKEIKKGDFISFNSWEEEKAYLDKVIAAAEIREQKD